MKKRIFVKRSVLNSDHVKSKKKESKKYLEKYFEIRKLPKKMGYLVLQKTEYP